MRFKFMNETVAKITIYVLTTVMVAAFVIYLVAARQYGSVLADTGDIVSSSAAGNGDVPLAGSTAEPDSFLATAPSSLALPEDTFGMRRLPDIPSSAIPTSQSQAPASVSAGNTPADSDSVAPLASDILTAEWERIQAMGIEIPETMSPEYKGTYHATAYCCEVYPHICGGNGVTASGTVPTPGLTAAADWGDLPPGTWIYIEDVGIRRIEDSGSAIKGFRLDVAIDTHENALRWSGFGSHEVWVLCWAES